ncbi:hypothetical protein SKAU_G00052150 [Synaphobranchus kaupii]|uniref:Uncharacterized protein n=1 Tax=Synaphobranchus kaupii TaxID=118154 RepID=A0A9Q1G3E0_SYNKA|nr:hypothetical protein SKAU_G00052150 [Synaphobranchus kaupii]
MFSDSRQLGQQRVPQRSNSPQHWLHNGVMVQRETACTGPSVQTEASLLPPDRRREARLTLQEEKGNSHVKERTETNFDGRNLQRRPLLTEQKHGWRPDPVSQRGPWDSGSARWNQAPELRQKRSSPGREPLRECVCSSHGYQTQPHPSGRKYVSPPPTGFKGQESYGVPGYMVERQFRGYARENYQRGSHVSGQAHAAACSFNRQHGSNSTFIHGQEYSDYNHGLRDLTRAKNRPEQGCNGPSSTQGLIFSTEVPQRELDYNRQRSLCWPGNVTDIQNKYSSREQGQKKDPGNDRPKMSQAAVRDQIRRVVVDLEGVLGGLKQVHLEMKEVVQQIELLTSNIDLGEEEPSNSFPSDTLCSSSSSGVMVSSHRGVGSHQPKQVDPACSSLRNTPTHSNPPALNPSVIVANQAAALSQHGNPPRNRTCASPTAGVPPATSPRGQESQNRTAQSRPTLPKPAFRSQNQPAAHGPGGTTCRSKKPPPYPHNGQVAKTALHHGVRGQWTASVGSGSSQRDGPCQLEEEPENPKQRAAHVTLDGVGQVHHSH